MVENPLNFSESGKIFSMIYLMLRSRVATVVAHELAHQWFGNLVTMKASPEMKLEIDDLRKLKWIKDNIVIIFAYT